MTMMNTKKWSLYEGCPGNDSICSDMDDCEKMLTDAWQIHCGPCIINVPEEFSNLELRKKCDALLILNDKETHNNNEQQHYDGFTRCKITTMICFLHWIQPVNSHFFVTLIL